MTIESISTSGRRKYRLHPDDNCLIQMQPKHGARWEDYRRADSWTEASKLVLVLAMSPEATVPMAKEETQEMEAVRQ